MKRLYRFAIIVASTALGAVLALYVARSPLSSQLVALLAGNKGENGSIFGTLFYLGVVGGVLMTLGILGGLFAGVVLARRVSKPRRPLELEAA